MLGYRVMIEVFLFLSVSDKWKSGTFIVVISPMKVVDFKQSWESRRARARVCVCV